MKDIFRIWFNSSSVPYVMVGSRLKLKLSLLEHTLLLYLIINRESLIGSFSPKKYKIFDEIIPIL